MSTRCTCDDVRALLFEFRRDEISDLKRAEVQAHLNQCPRCRELAEKSVQLFDEAKTSDASIWADVSADSLFDGIETQLGCDDEVSEEARQRLEALFEVARQSDGNQVPEIDGDALFGRIANEIESGPEPALTGHKNKAQRLQGSASPGAGLQWRRWAAAAAVVACLIGINWWVVTGSDESPSSPEIAEENTADDDPKPADLPSVLVDATQGESPGEVAVEKRALLPSLQAVEQPGDSLRLFASEDIDYRVDITDDEPAVELRRGSLLVEYFPADGESFSVRTATRRIWVTGTVFSVRVDGDGVEVAVYEGSVRIERDDGREVEIERGEVVIGDRRDRWPDHWLEEVQRHIDLETHRQKLRDRTAARRRQHQEQQEVAARSERELEHRAEREITARSKSEPRDTQKPDPSREQPTDEAVTPEPVIEDEESSALAPPSQQDAGPAVSPDEAGDRDDPVQKLRGEALQAFHGSEYRRATEALEEALEYTAPDDPVNADILLELARIRLRKLDEPQRAADHLRQLLAQWPDDPAADTVRGHLCADEALGGSDDPLCDDDAGLQ